MSNEDKGMGGIGVMEPWTPEDRNNERRNRWEGKWTMETNTNRAGWFLIPIDQLVEASVSVHMKIPTRTGMKRELMWSITPFTHKPPLQESRTRTASHSPVRLNRSLTLMHVDHPCMVKMSALEALIHKHRGDLRAWRAFTGRLFVYSINHPVTKTAFISHHSSRWIMNQTQRLKRRGGVSNISTDLPKQQTKKQTSSSFRSVINYLRVSVIL